MSSFYIYRSDYRDKLDNIFTGMDVIHIHERILDIIANYLDKMEFNESYNLMTIMCVNCEWRMSIEIDEFYNMSERTCECGGYLEYDM